MWDEANKILQFLVMHMYNVGWIKNQYVEAFLKIFFIILLLGNFF